MKASPIGTTEHLRQPSVVPTGLASLTTDVPSDKSLGYFRRSLRDRKTHHWNLIIVRIQRPR
jgi:hypothetical protein